ncbi:MULTISPECIES: SMP-30/gluconolactonase/LRE family protein [unclassified Pseudovibrio]|uniref:SMP-30/gluconolactonase/LRE family protein n=1 Tax=unclassified Pseudovibrio TaxID=2627060 RepID=UPI00070FEB02|nr:MULTISPECIES: SMP-30/gluconolactonase/LRE family protein [unclassified Pseudovibrio]KZL15200.1 SMP-30/Gluconolaconase/LRE-like region [Pseudovibrio sp. Ad26]
MWKGLIAAICLMLCAVRADASDWRILARFDDAPEGLVSDQQGGFFVSLFHSAEIYRVSADGEKTRIATLRDVIGSAKGSTIGIDFDGKDTLYVAFAEYSKRYTWPAVPGLAVEACADSTVRHSGLYAVQISTGQVEAVATRAEGYPFCFPDDPVIDEHGDIYLSDLSLKAIWKINPTSRKVDLWSKDPLFSGGDHVLSGYDVGVNGVALSPDGRALYGVTGGLPLLVRIPILADGSAGKAEMVAFGFANMDGLEVDGDGTFYLTETKRSEIWRLNPQADRREQLGNPLRDTLGAPASLAFSETELCVTNLNFFGHLPKEKANSVVCRPTARPAWSN